MRRGGRLDGDLPLRCLLGTPAWLLAGGDLPLHDHETFMENSMSWHSDACSKTGVPVCCMDAGTDRGELKHD